MTTIIQCLSAFGAGIGFSFVLRGHRHIKFNIIGALIGMFGWIVYVLCNFTNSVIVQTFIATLFISLSSEITARKQKAPATFFLVIGCFPLFPGKGIYESMLYCVQGDINAFISSFINTLGISIAIAFAILLVSTMYKILRQPIKKSLP